MKTKVFSNDEVNRTAEFAINELALLGFTWFAKLKTQNHNLLKKSSQKPYYVFFMKIVFFKNFLKQFQDELISLTSLVASVHTLKNIDPPPKKRKLSKSINI